ncbi:hypothetical protein HEL89_022070 [Escherichia coli]|nr:hypothetical protein [Escherichia coli]
MKKTLIALAVAASAAVSGSAMAAWVSHGTGSTVELGGTLTPVAKVTPWEVKTGDAVTALNGDVQKGQKVVDISVTRAIPVLGIRSIESKAFLGASGITPQIDYDGALNVDSFSNGRAPLTLEVRNGNNEKIGNLTTVMASGAEMSWVSRNGEGRGKFSLFAVNSGDAFFGGLGKSDSGIGQNGWYIANAISPEFVTHYVDQDAEATSPQKDRFDKTDTYYSGFYGSGIEAGQTIKITLDKGAAGDTSIQWKASLPVTVAYM